jgi:LysM repeat protein
MKKKRLIIFLLVCLFSGFLFAQESVVKHIVLADETVISIAQKYKVTPNDLYQLNPDLVNGIKESQVIIIPVSPVSKSQQLPKKEAILVEKSNNEIIYYTVKAGETKFGLAKRFNLSISQLEQQNPHIISGLQTDHKLEIRGGVDLNPFQKAMPTSAELNQNDSYEIYTVLPNETLYGISKRHRITVSELEKINKDYLFGILKSGQSLRVPAHNNQVTSSKNTTYHLVVAGETKYGLSKRYGVTIDELEQRNPQIVRMLQTGQQIVISGSKAEVSALIQEKALPKEVVKEEIVQEKAAITKPIVSDSKITSVWVDYEIQPKQTLYGLSKMTGLTAEKLIEKNPNLEIGVQAGMIIKIPGDKITAELASAYKVPSITESTKEEIKNVSEKPIMKPLIIEEPKGLLKTINKVESKELTLLMPFSIEKYDEFLKNKDLKNKEILDYDYYVGANFAIDSLKKLNLLVDVKTIEVELNKENKVDIASIKKNKVENSKAMLMFSDVANSEKVSELAYKTNTPFIVNQKVEGIKSTSSTYIGIPSKNEMAKAMLNYMATKNGNLIVISDNENYFEEEFIRAYFPKTRFINIINKDILESEVLLNELILNKKNFIILNTNKTGLILNATTILLKESTTYQIQLALLEPKESIVGEGLSDMRFKALKMLYPSYSKRLNQKEIVRFEKDFSKKYNYSPNERVLQGFELTFDTLVRLFQDVSFESTAKDIITEQSNYTFQYYLDVDGSYSNKGIYILQYDVESDSKLAN